MGAGHPPNGIGPADGDDHDGLARGQSASHRGLGTGPRRPSRKDRIRRPRPLKSTGLLLQLADHAGDPALPDISFKLMAIFTRLVATRRRRLTTRMSRPSSAVSRKPIPDRRARAVASFALAKFEKGLAQDVAVLKLAPRKARRLLGRTVGRGTRRATQGTRSVNLERRRRTIAGAGRPRLRRRPRSCLIPTLGSPGGNDSE